MIDSGQETAPAHQVAALCYRTSPRLEVLLVTSRETKRWVTPKGWPMKNRTDFEAAAIEAFEEAGVQGDIANEPLGKFGYDKTLKSGDVREVLASLYALEVSVVLEDWPERKQRTRAWFAPEDAANAVDECDLADLIRAFGLKLAR